MYYKGEKYEPNPQGAAGDFQGQGDDMRKELLKILAPLKETALKALDLGTGFGSNAAFLSKNLSVSARIWSLDPSQEVLTGVEERFNSEGLGSNVTFVKGTIEELPFENNFFDIIVSLAVLHHLERLELGVKELQRVLKAGSGNLLLVDFSPEAHTLGFKSRHAKEDFFDAKRVVSLLERAQFSSVSFKKFPFWYLVQAER